MSGLSPKLPISRNSIDGFTLTKTYNELIKQNLMNLVLTSPGERVMDINFGVGIRNFLFEQDTVEARLDIEEKIHEQVLRYMPFISIEQVGFPDLSPDNLSKLHIVIQYSIKTTGTLDALSFTVDLV